MGYSKRKISWFLLLRLVFGTSMLYDLFEKLMFGDSCLIFCPYLKVVVFCIDFLNFCFFFTGFWSWIIVKKIDWFILFGLVLESLCYMSFERLMFGNSCLTICLNLKVIMCVVCFVQIFLFCIFLTRLICWFWHLDVTSIC